MFSQQRKKINTEKTNTPCITENTKLQFCQISNLPQHTSIHTLIHLIISDNFFKGEKEQCEGIITCFYLSIESAKVF